MKSFKKFFLENTELDENIGGLFKDASEWESSAKARGLVVKSMTHPSGETTKYQIAKDKQGNNRGHFDHGTKSGRLKEEVELEENIKGWKHAASDISKMRAAQGKSVKLVSLKKDGTESKMHDATKMFRSEDEAQEHHDRVTKLNPKSKIKHNLYVDGKHVKTLGESLEEAAAPKFKKGDKVQYETSKYSKDNSGVVHSHDGDQVTIVGKDWLGAPQKISVHQSFVRKQK